MLWKWAAGGQEGGARVISVSCSVIGMTSRSYEAGLSKGNSPPKSQRNEPSGKLAALDGYLLAAAYENSAGEQAAKEHRQDGR